MKFVTIEVKCINYEVKMKVFKIRDNDGGRNTIVCASDIIKAIELFNKAYNCPPEWVEELCVYKVIIEDLIEPEYGNEIPL